MKYAARRSHLSLVTGYCTGGNLMFPCSSMTCSITVLCSLSFIPSSQDICTLEYIAAKCIRKRLDCYNIIIYISLQPGRAPHEPVKVPFVLLPSTQNEGQFAYTVESFIMPQHLKGTLTYFVKVSLA